MTSSEKVMTENCTVRKSETARKSSPNLGKIRTKAILKVDGRAKRDKECFVVQALATSGADCRAKIYVDEKPRNLHPREKALKIVRKKSRTFRKMCHWA